MIVGIDASNLRQGGGLTHLIELISVLQPDVHNFEKIVIWSNSATLSNLKNASWLIKISPIELNQSLIYRLIWQKFKLTRSALDNKCDLVFSPGGSVFCNFKPIVTMSRNMLPFEWSETKRYGASLITFRLILLRWLQSKSFHSASGVIFLTEYAQKQVLKKTGNLSGSSTVIPHGLNARFRATPKPQKSISEYSLEKPFQVIYVSIIDQYKHQWFVVEAIAKLKSEGYPITLNLVGPSYPSSLKRLKKAIKKFDINGNWVKYHGAIPYMELHNIYNDSQLGVFASSCENMPNILLEKMISGLPIACSNKGSMPEVLGDAGEYFNPERPSEIYHALKKLINDPQLRLEKSQASFHMSQQYTWDICSLRTFLFLEKIYRNHNQSCAE